jgi:Ca-activated chloride channel family protein
MSLDFDPYEILGVATSATAEEIKNAYRRFARRLHPDTNPHHPGAALQFRDISAAHDLLNDAIKRRMYDEKARRLREQGDLSFSMRVTPSRHRIPQLAEPQVVYLLAEINPDHRAALSPEDKREARLNLTLVLDRSNSMNGPRLEKVKVAAHQIVDGLTSNDILSVVTFSDRAEVIIPATPVRDKLALKARISMFGASGGTEIFHGLSAGVQQNRQFLGPKLVNHLILLTDGRTFGDQDQCLELAQQATKEGIGISAMGLGDEWNDDFLDALASKTGGTSEYISTAGAVVRFLNDRVRGLANAFAERMQMTVAPESDVKLELAFRLNPNPQPLELGAGELQLGNLQFERSLSVLLQLQIPNGLAVGYRPLARLVAQGDVLQNKQQRRQAVRDLTVEVLERPELEKPSTEILDALSKLTLYRLQEKAQEALATGNIAEATRRLENLATRLLALGQNELATQALTEARRVAHTSGFSDKGRMTIKYQTRHLMLNSGDQT